MQKAPSFPLGFASQPPFSIEAPDYKPVEGETVPRRHPRTRELGGLMTSPLNAPDVHTVFDMLAGSAKRWPDRHAVGSRRLVQKHVEKKTVAGIEKEWTYLELSGYEYLTYTDFRALTLQLGAGLRKLGMEKGDRLHVFASTSANWMAMAHAVATQSLTLVTAYDTLGPSGVEHSLVQTGARAMFVDPHLLKTVEAPLKAAGDQVSTLIYNDASLSPVPEAQIEAFKAGHPNLKVVSFSELRKLGEESPVEPTVPAPEDTFCIMYTSGSMGKPKGVVVTHANVVAAVSGEHACVFDFASEEERIIAYLPLAHIFELVLENLVLHIGGCLGYGSPRTLSDSGVRGCKGDMREFRPTAMVGVPQVWEAIRKGVQSRVDASGALQRAAFNFALATKAFLVNNRLPGQGIFDSAIFGSVREATGGKMRFLMNGATGISEGTARWLSLVVAPLIGGYGLTETCGNGGLGSPLFWAPNTIGVPTPAIEVKLVSLPDLGYTADSTPPRGEILIRGPAVVKSYYEDPDLTAQAWTADGWFRTGDVGEWDSSAQLRVIDRAKNLVKLQGGEYIALEKLEAVYRGSRFVQSIMVFGDSSRPRPMAIIHPNEKLVAETPAATAVLEKNPKAHVLQDPTVRQAVLKDLVAVGKKAGLSPLEILSGVVLGEEEWTPDSGLVTATSKVNRRAIKERFAKEIASCP